MAMAEAPTLVHTGPCSEQALGDVVVVDDQPEALKGKGLSKYGCVMALGAHRCSDSGRLYPFLLPSERNGRPEVGFQTCLHEYRKVSRKCLQTRSKDGTILKLFPQRC